MDIPFATDARIAAELPIEPQAGVAWFSTGTVFCLKQAAVCSLTHLST